MVTQGQNCFLFIESVVYASSLLYHFAPEMAASLCSPVVKSIHTHNRKREILIECQVPLMPSLSCSNPYLIVKCHLHLHVAYLAVDVNFFLIFKNFLFLQVNHPTEKKSAILPKHTVASDDLSCPFISLDHPACPTLTSKGHMHTHFGMRRGYKMNSLFPPTVPPFSPNYA